MLDLRVCFSVLFAINYKNDTDGSKIVILYPVNLASVSVDRLRFCWCVSWLATVFTMRANFFEE